MSSQTAFQISIPKRAACCAHGQEPLTPGMEYYSILKDDGEDGSYVRHDYCPTCWQQLHKQSATQTIRSSWKSHIPSKKEASELPKQRDERALLLLKEALLRQDSEAEAEAFMLALYLARRRRLFLRQEMEIKKGKRSSLFEVAETEEMLCVPKLSLSDLQIEKLQIELAKRFQS